MLSTPRARNAPLHRAPAKGEDTMPTRIHTNVNMCADFAPTKATDIHDNTPTLVEPQSPSSLPQKGYAKRPAHRAHNHPTPKPRTVITYPACLAHPAYGTPLQCRASAHDRGTEPQRTHASVAAFADVALTEQHPTTKTLRRRCRTANTSGTQPPPDTCPSLVTIAPDGGRAKASMSAISRPTRSRLHAPPLRNAQDDTHSTRGKRGQVHADRLTGSR